MSTNLVRMKFAAVAAKIEVTPGVDSIGGTPAAADWLASEMEVQFDPTIIEIPELTGSLDKATSVVGGLKPRLRLRMPLRGSGAADPAMQALIRRVGRCAYVQEKREPYEALVRAIAHQQLHGAAARTILGRFTALHPESPFPTPEQVLSTDDAAMRACGFSAGKTAAIRDIACKTLDGVVPNRRAAARLSDMELIERLTVIRGVGRWTVEMLLMFNLNRMDILPVDDFGVREGYRKLHALAVQPKPKELAAIGEMWSPWRSVASWYLWRAAEEGRPVRAPTP